MVKNVTVIIGDPSSLCLLRGSLYSSPGRPWKPPPASDFLSRELFDIKQRIVRNHERDFTALFLAT